MITITNGSHTFQVTKGAFKDIFKAQGYIPVSENQTETRAEVSEDLVEESITLNTEDTTEAISVQESDDSETEVAPERELSEIPLSEMTNAQLKAYADQLGVDLKGITSRKAVINKLKSAL